MCGMKVLMLSTDQKIFEEGSAVRQRMIDYGTIMDELHVIVYTKRGFRIQNLGFRGNVFVYPTNTRFKPFYFFDAYKIAASILRSSQDSRSCEDQNIERSGHWLITCQDPFETWKNYFQDNSFPFGQRINTAHPWPPRSL